jgi:hypothetical protein
MTLPRLQYVTEGLAIRSRIRALTDQQLADLVALYTESCRLEIITLNTARREQHRRKAEAQKRK